MHSLIAISCLLLALTTQGVPLTSNESNRTMSERHFRGHTMIVDSDVHDNIMNSRQATEEPSDSESPRARRAFFIEGGTSHGNVVSIRQPETQGQAMLQRNPTKPSGFFINGQPLVVAGADGSRTLNPALSSDYSPPISNEAPMPHDHQLRIRESIDERNTTETPVEHDSRDFHITSSNVYKNVMKSGRSIDERDTTETPVEHDSRDFHIIGSNVYKNQMISRRSIDDRDTTETPVEHDSRDFHIDRSNVYKNQMISRRSIDERDTTETPVMLGSRDFHFSNNNIFDNQNNTRTELDTPPLPKNTPK